MSNKPTLEHVKPNSHPVFDEILRSCRAYLDGKLEVDQLKKQLQKSVIGTAIKTNTKQKSLNKERYENLHALQSIISFFVRGTEASEIKALGRIQTMTDTIIAVIQRQFGFELPGFGIITFDTISDIKRAYWSARAEKTLSRDELKRPHHVIRINDIPFAESVFPALLSRNSELLGYSVVVEDVPWSDVGAALYNGRIDVALYNSALLTQLKSVETLFKHKLIYSSDPLIRYEGYAVIWRRPKNVEMTGKIGVPWKSDFSDVVRENTIRGSIRIKTHPRPGSHSAFVTQPRLRAKNVVFKSSADEVLQAVVDDELEFGVVGGLQARYAEKQFPKYGPNKTSFYVRTIGYLNMKDVLAVAPDSKADCKFWVAVNRRDEAATLISAMTTLWNELVVRGWDAASNDLDDKLRWNLVDIVNGHKHRSYIDDFPMLQKLIKDHDDGVGKEVKYTPPRLETP